MYSEQEKKNSDRANDGRFGLTEGEELKEIAKEERETERRRWRITAEEKFWEKYVEKVRNNRRRKKCLVNLTFMWTCIVINFLQ